MKNPVSSLLEKREQASHAAPLTVCSCGWKFQGSRCPSCHAWNMTSRTTLESDEGWHPESPSQIRADKVSHVSLEDPALDAFFDGGPVRSACYEWASPPGFGKTTWMLECLQFFKHPLYVTSEQSKGAIKLMINRLGLDVPHARIVATQDLEEVYKNISDEYDALILDSVDQFRCSDSSAAIGSDQMKASVVRLGAKIVRHLGMVGFFVSQVNKEGEAAGRMADQHNVDGTIWGEDLGLNQRRFEMRKHRHGPAGIKIRCTMTARGLENFVLEERTKK